MLVVTRQHYRFLSLVAFLLLLGAQALLSACESSQPVTNPLTNKPRTNTPSTNTPVAHPVANFPTVDPDYIYDSLFYLVTHFQKRQSGYLPPAGSPDGHTGFATYWTQEITRDLQGFGPQTSLDTFRTSGWAGRPPNTDSTNVAVTVPGASHAEQTVVIGCHYDGETSSTQSANDDASGCAIELGVAKALATFWRSNHLLPARTLRFMLYDAEEQGLLGSFHYVNKTTNGDLSSIVAMFNEEQNGIAYPLRFLGKTSNPLLPFSIDISPTHNNLVYPQQAKISDPHKAQINRFNALMARAIQPVFAQFRAMGDGSLTYLNNQNQPVTQQIFGTDQLGNIHQQEDNEGGSDQIPFTMAGLPCATFVGNASYYDGPAAPAWSYPYDQPQDTIQLMNTFASGYADKAKALTLSLALPGMLTTWMLHQPEILGEVNMPNHPVGTFDLLGLAQPDHELTFNAYAFDPTSNTKGAFSYAWDFGDGGQSAAQNVTYRYKKAGTFTVVLTISSANGAEKISKALLVSNQPTQYTNPYSNYTSDGFPPSNPNVKLPVPRTR